ncbi:tautomerase family protein [Actinomycetes bacterium M1A6_2h]
MPLSQIEVRRTYSDEEATSFIDALHAALRVAFKIPDRDKHICFVEHRAARFAVPDTLGDPDRYTLVSIDAFAGRSLDAKRDLYREIATRFAVLGVPKDHITVIVRDIPTDSWGIAGGHAATDLDLGFDINV